MVLRLYNTLSRSLETFTPADPPAVSIYCCGVTVYDRCHLGHARSYIVWDLLRRYLRWRGYTVRFVQNFTDIDDKIIHRAQAEGTSVDKVSERNIALFFEDMEALNILPADDYPRATRCLDSIRALIAELIHKGAAYPSCGDVYFAVMQASNYGQLSGRNPEQQQEGASGRIDDDSDRRKRHPFDFALWKAAKTDEPSYPSAWGAGRPGWHIECSAMVREAFGNSVDIHVGGADLVFPHHENEIAQSEAASGEPLARYWLHNGMVNVGGTKMSKSLGNFTTIRALLDGGVSPMALRLFILQAHYRKPIDFTTEAMAATATAWRGLQAALLVGIRHGTSLGWNDPGQRHGEQQLAFEAALDDDLNSSGGLAVLFALARPLKALANRLDHGGVIGPEDHGLEATWRSLVELAGVMGLDAVETPPAAVTAVGEATIAAAIAARLEARKRRDYAAADRIRSELLAKGITLIDQPGGKTEWISSLTPAVTLEHSRRGVA